MALNNYIRLTGTRNEQDLAQSLIDEHIKIDHLEVLKDIYRDILISYIES